MNEPKLRCLSLGAGVQSTTMALMADAGEFDSRPDCAIFSDTGWEPREVYEHLDRLQMALSFPVYRISKGSILDSIKRQAGVMPGRFASVPWWTTDDAGKKTAGRRQCTREFKMEPIAKKQRELLGYAKGQRIPVGSVECWIGISTDEAMRMKPGFQRWQVNRWPLIEKHMSRADCLRWLEAHGWTAPKSACIGCPYRSDSGWRRLKDNNPAEWADAVAVDKMIRTGGSKRGMRGEQFMHPSLKPLDEVDLSTDVERGQTLLFNNECEGMCGV